MKSELMRYAHDAASSPAVVKTAATVTAGTGLSTVFGFLEKGVGFVASIAALMVTIALWKKLKLERKEAELRIQVLERRLEATTEVNQDGKP